MKIVFVSSECTPYAATGGLADVSDALPRALVRAGHQVTRVLPMFRQALSGDFDIQPQDQKLTVPMSYRNLEGELWQRDEEPGLQTLFVRRDEYYDRAYLYGRPDRDYDDNVARFVFFQKAAVALIDMLGLKPDIVHCNDWQTGLVPMYLRHGFQGTGRIQTERTVFTIHNLAYQGIFPGADLSFTGLPFSCFTMDTMEFYGDMSFIKGGITSADLVTTVSPSYADEIRTEAFGFGLHGILQTLGDRLSGILNGMDSEHWNPADDPALPAAYNAEKPGNKKVCRDALLEEFGLDPDPDTAVVGMIGRLVEQKGFDLLDAAIDAIMERPIRLVVLGTGESRFEKAVMRWQKRWPDRVGARIDFDRDLSHRIEAGSDFFLMPSRFEPCGLNQMYSLRYGTLPIVHGIGGLKDSVTDLRQDPDQGTGLVFNPFSAKALLSALDDACTIFKDQAALKKIRQRAMRLDLSWNRAASAYCALYESLLSKT